MPIKVRSKGDVSKEFFEKMEFNRSILEVIIYFASKKGEKVLPTIHEFILSEIVAATIEYVTGEEQISTFNRSSFGEVPDLDWEWKTNEAMETTRLAGGRPLNPILGAALKELTFLRHTTDAMGDGGWGSDLYLDWQLICPVIMRSTFSLSVAFVGKVKKEVIPKIDAKTIRQCRSIAELMKRKIDDDVALIGRRYHW